MSEQTVIKENYTIKEVCELKNLGITTVYAALNSGALIGVKIGKKTLVTATSLDAWWASLPKWQPSKPAAQRTSKRNV